MLTGIEEEGLLQAPETTSPKEHQPAPPSHDAKSSTLPEPPVEHEASGSGPDHLDNMSEPSTAAAEEEEEVSLEETESDEAEETRAGVAAVGEEPTETPLKEEHLDEDEIQAELEISTISSETKEERGPPALSPATEAEVLESESEADSSEIILLPDDVDIVAGAPDESIVEVNLKEPEEDATTNVFLTHPEEPAFRETDSEEAAESEGRVGMDGTSSEAVLIQEEAPLTPEILSDDLLEDEILLVNKDPDSSVSGSPSAPQPTSLSAEVESPFTIISDIITDSKGQPEAAITLLVEVKVKIGVLTNF